MTLSGKELEARFDQLTELTKQVAIKLEDETSTKKEILNYMTIQAFLISVGRGEALCTKQ